jgi:hypothetical protein
VNGHSMVRPSLQSYRHSFVKRFSPELSSNRACSRFTLMYLPRSPCYILALRFLSSTYHPRVQQAEATCLSFPTIDVSIIKLIAVASRGSCTGKFDEWRFPAPRCFGLVKEKGSLWSVAERSFKFFPLSPPSKANTHLNPGYIFASCKHTLPHLPHFTSQPRRSLSRYAS